MKNQIVALIVVLCSIISLPTFAANMTGVYRVSVKGSTYYTNKTPNKKAIVGDTYMHVKQTGENVTIEWGGFGGNMSNHIMKGKAGNNLVVASLNSTNSSYHLTGKARGTIISGTYLYLRDGNGGVVPGWTELKFTATKIKEDCIGFNTSNVKVLAEKGKYTVTDGRSRMIYFGTNKAAAYKAVKIIKHYKMNKQCFAIRPNPSLKFFTVNGQLPKGAMAGDDCVSFDGYFLEVKNISGNYTVVQGNHYIIKCKSKEEAQTVLALMKYYKAQKLCFVGRPNAPMMYLRRN